MLSGAFTALVTPFDSAGEIDFPGMAKLLAWHEAAGMDGVVLAGTNGEGPSLSTIEKRDLVRFAVQHAGKLKVIAGAGTCSLTEAIYLCNQAGQAGAAAALVLPPFYFQVTQEGIHAWFARLLGACSLPIIIYNFPKTTRVTLEPTTIQRLFDYPNAAGIKDSSGDETLLREYLSVANEKSRLMFVGDERLLLKALNAGGSGTVSGLANSFPTLIARQVRERSEALQTLIDEACSVIKAHPQPAVHKAVLDYRGLPGGLVRPPLEPLTAGAIVEVQEFVAKFDFA